MAGNPMAGPLHGITVLDFSELLPGPFLTQGMVEMGARVVKLERPPAGDPVRRLAPGLFAAVNRGKESRLLDLKSPAGLAEALRLAEQADVLVESFRPGVMARLGLGYEALAARNPRLVYVSLSGYGQDGPYAAVPGHDLNYLAVTGMTAIADGSAGVPVADLCGATYGLAGVLAALLQRGTTGRGQWLDVSLTECALHWMNPRLARFGGASLEEQRRMASTRPAYGVFPCRDGKAITIAALEDHFWRHLAEAMDLSPFGTAAYAHVAQRAPVAGEINAVLAARCALEDRDPLLARLLAADVPASPVVLPSEVADFPVFTARAVMQASAAGPLARFPVRLDGMAAPGAAPALGGDAA